MRIKLFLILLLFLSAVCYSEELRIVTEQEAYFLELLFPDSEIVKDQSFYLTMEGTGNVYFVSIYHYPDDNEYLAFYLVQDNSVIAEFPVLYMNDYIMKTVYAVSFFDMNKDGWKDITILVECFIGAGARGAIPEYFAAVYINNMQGGFANDPETDEEISIKFSTDDDFNAISDIADYIDQKYNNQPW